MFDEYRFTEHSRKALEYAQNEAREMGFNYVGTEHLLLGILDVTDCTATQILAQMNVDADKVREDVIRLTGKGDGEFNGDFGLTPRTKNVIENTNRIALQMKHDFVGTEHMMVALIHESSSIAVRVLADLKVDMRTLNQALLQALGVQPGQQGASGAGMPGAQGGSKMEQFTRDLTKAAKNGELDPVIGREKEIERVIQILSRRTKNNPVLIGEPGVGKTAVVEGLAQRVVQGNIPEMLKGKRVLALDLSGMLAGAKYRGEFEERIKGALDEMKKAKDVILFIDELHTIVGAGAAEGAMDAANILKPALARGEMQTIGATTLDEYRKHIEKDSALERRFQPVMVGEPSNEESILILKGLRDRYEAHHKVRITDGALEAAVNLSSRYIADRYLPDKAIDLMDEAASRVRIQTHTAPPDMKALEKELDEVTCAKNEAVAGQNFEKAAQERDREKDIRRRMEEARKAWEESNEAKQAVVDADQIAEIVSAWTHIPVKQMTESEAERLLHLEDLLHQRVVGQQEAISAVSRAIRRARAGLKDPKRPIGSFIFLGPTGVGKTELCKALAEAMFGDEDALVRVDMSEYMEKFAVSRLIGAPPGYVGYEEGGQLTEKVRRKPYCVVLLDEIEKAHPDVFNILLQIMEDGRLTDGQGRTVDFRNTILIMTSNVGASQFGSQHKVGFGTPQDAKRFEDMKETAMEALKDTFRPEFLNRIDEIIVFHKLTSEDTRHVVDIMLNQVLKRIAEQGITLTVTDPAKDYLAREGFDEQYGARPLRRAIQRMVEDALSEELLGGKVALGDTLAADVQDDKLIFTKGEGEKTGEA